MNRLSVPTLIVVSLGLVPSVRAQDWPIFRGPTGDGHSVVKNLPTKWSKTENVRWHVDLPGKGWSSPVLVAGKLYFTAAITANGPAAVKACKQLVKDVAGHAIDASLRDDTARRIANIRVSPEGREGVQSFLKVLNKLTL